ncbi:hypothetical protein HDU83_007713 [Entophlyctis luteolus]|nr:hypothetical protein HDU83_007713 [Entophlyctis luteolus]
MAVAKLAAVAGSLIPAVVASSVHSLFGMPASSSSGSSSFFDEAGALPYLTFAPQLVPRLTNINNGPVLSKVEVVPLLFGDFEHRNELDAFYSFITASPWMRVMAQYGVAQSTSVEAITAPVSSSLRGRTIITSEEIESELFTWVLKGILKPTANTYFPVHFASGIRIVDTSTNSSSCTEWCGYHSALDLSTITDESSEVNSLFYAVMPQCSNICGVNSAGKTLWDDHVSTSSHELAEACTNPYAVNPLAANGRLAAWFDVSVGVNSGEGEIADICAT